MKAGWEMETSPPCENADYYNCAQMDATKRCFAEMEVRSFTWVMFGDLDEFLANTSEDIPLVQTRSNNTTPLQLLTADFPGSSALSFGIHNINKKVCNLSLEELHDFPFVSSLPYCYDPRSEVEDHELCTTWIGKRKSLVRPPRTKCCGVHKWDIKYKYKYTYSVTDIRTSFVRLNELRGKNNMTELRESCVENATVMDHKKVNWAGR